MGNWGAALWGAPERHFGDPGNIFLEFIWNFLGRCADYRKVIGLVKIKCLL